MNDIEIVYTPWSNLKKTDGMDVGQVGFHKEKEVRKMKVAKRNNAVVNRLDKTKKEAHPGKILYMNLMQFSIFIIRESKEEYIQ